MMNEEFCNYEQSLILKELGFDEDCIMYWRPEMDGSMQLWYHQDNTFWEAVGSNNSDNAKWVTCTAPLKQQVFRWFREKHGLHTHFVPEFYIDGINFNWQILWYLPKEEWSEYIISNGTMLYGDNGEYPTQEDAENACIDEMIKIVKKTL